jgi:hypothetical protein
MAQDERDRQLDQADPGLVGELGELLGGLELALVLRQRHVEAVGEPSAGRRHRALDLGVLAIAPRQPAARERAVGDHAHPVALTCREYVVLHRAGEDGVGRLLGAEALAAAPLGGPLGLDDLRGREGGVADVADLALMHEITERAEHLVDVGVGIRAVDLVEIDPFGPQPQ